MIFYRDIGFLYQKILKVTILRLKDTKIGKKSETNKHFSIEDLPVDLSNELFEN